MIYILKTTKVHLARKKHIDTICLNLVFGKIDILRSRSYFVNDTQTLSFLSNKTRTWTKIIFLRNLKVFQKVKINIKYISISLQTGVGHYWIWLSICKIVLFQPNYWIVEKILVNITIPYFQLFYSRKISVLSILFNK